MNAIQKPLRVYIVVEDSPLVQRRLASAIVEAGAELNGCSADAQTAIADLVALKPDVIFIDVRLTSGSGFDVLKALQNHGSAWKTVKVVLTNYANAEYREQSVRLGADRFFDKSSEFWQALGLINALVAERRSGSGAPPGPSTAIS